VGGIKEEDLHSIYDTVSGTAKLMPPAWLWVIGIVVILLVFGPAIMRGIGANVQAYKYLRSAMEGL